MTKTDKLKHLDDLRNQIQNEKKLLFDNLISIGSMYRAGKNNDVQYNIKKLLSKNIIMAGLTRIFVYLKTGVRRFKILRRRGTWVFFFNLRDLSRDT